MKQDDEAERWFYNLGLMAQRVEASEKRNTVLRRRQWVAVAFMFFAFMLLAWRSEINANGITKQQRLSCESSRAILVKFNTQQATLAQLERLQGREAAAKVYDSFRIDPLPVCRRTS